MGTNTSFEGKPGTDWLDSQGKGNIVSYLMSQKPEPDIDLRNV